MMCSGSVCAEFYTYSITVIEIQVYNTARQTDTIKSKIQYYIRACQSHKNNNKLLILLKNNTHFKLSALFFFWRYCTGNLGTSHYLFYLHYLRLVEKQYAFINKGIQLLRAELIITKKVHLVCKQPCILGSIW